MTPLKELLDRIRQEEKLPDVVAGRCVHEIVDMASCSSCVDACPQQAWSLDDEALCLDTTHCDGCGLCMPACPEGAISVDHEVLVGEWEQRKIALCACEKAGMPQKTGVVPCVHLFGLKDILKLQKLGYSEWFVATGSCSECKRNQGVKLADRVDEVNLALSDTQVQLLTIHLLNKVEWQRVSTQLVEGLAASRLSRRGFLRGMLDGGVGSRSVVMELYENDSEDFTTPGELMPERDLFSVWPNLPCIDAVHCNGCDACMKLCPHDAIELVDYGESICYRIAPQACSGCGICMDACDLNAITVKSWSRMETRDVALQRMKCSSCGNLVHVPAESSLPSRIHCRICAQVNHQKNLYQIVE
ncbi:MAG: 4Fe-4S binding protein [Candidatus Thiodiazotropha sp.]